MSLKFQTLTNVHIEQCVGRARKNWWQLWLQIAFALMGATVVRDSLAKTKTRQWSWTALPNM